MNNKIFLYFVIKSEHGDISQYYVWAISPIPSHSSVNATCKEINLNNFISYELKTVHRM